MTYRIAVKRLSAVEVDPSRSHQHEFHAGRLRRELSLERVTQGSITLLLLAADGSVRSSDDDAFTLYDARAGNPRRSSEWRLYFRSRVLESSAQPGDTLLLYSRGANLCGVIAPGGSAAETSLRAAIGIGDEAIEERFRFIDAPLPTREAAVKLAAQLTLPLGSTRAYPVTAHPVFARAVADGAIPSTLLMAQAARDLLGSGAAGLDPDAYLSAALEAESELYFKLEDEIHGDGLRSLVAASPDLTNIIDFAMRIQQSRRSRRGQSLQNHFASVLTSNGIPYSAQCRTETGETPDFIVPGCSQYHDDTFPAHQLRMVACKTTAKERWRQVLNEAVRVPEKYLLTLDEDLSGATLSGMRTAQVSAFVPRPVLGAAYGTRPLAERPGSVADLVHLLRTAVQG